MSTATAEERRAFEDQLAQLEAHQTRVIAFLLRLMELPHEKLPEDKLEWEQYSRLILGIALNVFQEKAMLEEVAVVEKLIRQPEAHLAELKGEKHD